MKPFIFTLLACLSSIFLFGQFKKPLYPPSTKTINSSENKALISSELIGLPKSKRTISTTFRPRSLPPLTRKLGVNTGLEVVQTSKEGTPIMIRGSLKNVATGRDISLQVYDYLEAIKSPILIKKPKEEFVLISRNTDELGQTHFKLQQQYKGVKVYGGQVLIHAQNGKVNLFNGRNFATPSLENIVASITQEKAQSIANQEIEKLTTIKNLSKFEQKLIGELKQPELVIYHTADLRQAQLAWHLHLYPNAANQWEYFIDAQSGVVLESYKTLCQLHHGVDEVDEVHGAHVMDEVHGVKKSSKLSIPSSIASPENGPATSFANDLNNFNRKVNSYEIGGDFFLIDASKAMFSANRSNLPNEPVGALWTIDGNNGYPGNDDFDASHVLNNNNSWNDKLPVSAHYNAGIAYDYFNTTFGRNSINGKGGTIISVVNVSDEDGSNLENAFWSGSAMFYGNGGNQFLPLAKSLDVAAHEMSHGVIQNTANLRYQGESGAMNESFADVFGVLVDRDDWQLGEDVVNRNIFRTGALRDLQNPNNGGNGLEDIGWQPDHVSQQYRGKQDNGGVHINSGISNKAFFLIANTIGKAKAEKIYYRALTTYLVNTSQFVDLRASIIQSATDIHGTNSNEIAVAVAAFDQVGILGSNSGNGEQSGGAEEIEVDANPGEDFIVYTDESNSAIYLADGKGKILLDPFTTTGILSRPSITDDGSAIVFIASDKTMHLITIDWENGGEASEEVIQDEPIWRNVAVSRDGFRIAALADEITSQIEVFDFTIGEFKTYNLYNPTFTEGISTGEVNFADVIEFDFSGEFVMYDASNSIKGNFGTEDIEYWDIGFLKVYDNTIDNYEQDEDNNIFKLFSGLPENVGIGNPTFSKNSPNIIAYEYFDTFDQTEDEEQIFELRALNLTTNNENTLFRSLILHVPNFSRLDDKIIFNATIDNTVGIAEIALAADKISAATGDAFALIEQTQGAKLGVWFSDGSRQLTPTNELEKSLLNLSISPNPFSNDLNIQFSLEKRKNLNIEVFNTLGQRLITKKIEATSGKNTYHLATNKLPNGTYLVSIISEEGIVSLKVVK